MGIISVSILGSHRWAFHHHKIENLNVFEPEKTGRCNQQGYGLCMIMYVYIYIYIYTVYIYIYVYNMLSI